MKKTWQSIEFEDILSKNRKKNRIIGLSFPQNNNSLGLEPSVISVLPHCDEAEYCAENFLFNDDDVKYYVCSVYISGMDEFIKWALGHDFNKIIVGGYHPTTFPEDFIPLAHKIVRGPCDDFFKTIQQDGQIVSGIYSGNTVPRHDLYDVKNNQQIIPDKMEDDICSSINTSMGCPFKCDFCCTPMMAPKLLSRTLTSLTAESEIIKKKNPKWLFIRDENFPLQKDWKERLEIINSIGAKTYMFASANLLTNLDDIKFMKDNNVYMVCLGLEDISVDYPKNKHLKSVIQSLKANGIYTYLSFIVDPLKIVGKQKGIDFYTKLIETLNDLLPEMVCGNFLMPFRGTKIWDDYYQFVAEEDYKHYDSKSAFLIKNKLLREKMEFFMFWYQWQYYTSDIYNEQVRKFDANDDTLYLRFAELYGYFRTKYERIWNERC